MLQKCGIVNKLKTKAQIWLIYKQTNMNELFIESTAVIHD